MPRSRLISIFPEGAIRLVPTLITTRIVWRDCGPGQPAILRCRETPTRRTRRPPAGRDNISILPLEWLSGKVINCRIGSLYACFERHQPLFRSRGKLCALQAGISSGSLASPGTRMRTRAGPCGRGHCFGHGDLDPDAAKKWKYGFRRRTQRRDAPGGRATAGIVSEIHERGGNGGSYYASRRERRFRHRSPGGALVDRKSTRLNFSHLSISYTV